MDTTSRKASDSKTRREKSKDEKNVSKDETKKSQDEKLKKSAFTVSSRSDFLPKSSTADIYQKKSAQNTKAPRKSGVTNTSNVSPMKGLLKSSASSISQISRTEKTPVKKVDAKTTLYSARKSETPRKPLTNVTVNSPIAKRRLDLNLERVSKSSTKEVPTQRKELTSLRKSETPKQVRKQETSLRKEVLNISKSDSTDVYKGSSKEGNVDRSSERQRTKTRTLDESEVKILTLDAVDNNAGMRGLSKKLAANPKAFYVDLDEPKSEKDKVSDEEVSYEDDFESYESDFESYHSEQTEAEESSDKSERSEKSEREERIAHNDEMTSVEESSLKESKDEEKMLDSGNFELRDQRSAKSKPAAMDFILETAEDHKKVSLTDEGFQDMSSSSGVNSIRTVDVLDRTLFIDFTKSKQNRLKRQVSERLKQRAGDLLSMITLHEMTYFLFEMQPISYDLYMATFGRTNYTQSGVQTFEDGITEEIQMEEVPVSQKWTQYPVDFSKNDIYLHNDVTMRKYSSSTEDYLTQFTFMVKQNIDAQTDRKINSDESFKSNPLRIYIEQKDGVGCDEMMHYETYNSKLKNNNYSTDRLRKFLKKVEVRVSHVLSSNAGLRDTTELVKSPKIPFSKGYISLSPRTISDERLSFLSHSKITSIIFSGTKSNLVLTVHKSARNIDVNKSVVCLWDIGVARGEPTKILIAIDDVVIGKYRGNADGVFVAALKDGSMHLWDLSEEPTWRGDVVSDKKTTEFVEVESDRLTEFEIDREWNLKNSHLGFDKCSPPIALQSCAYTNSAFNMSNDHHTDAIVGLEVTGDLDSGRRLVGQIISLQRIGILTIWSIIQEKLKSSKDIGKAFWSKMKLEKFQTINLTDHIDISSKGSFSNDTSASNFNLNAAKRRLSLRKQEKNLLKKNSSRPKSAVSKFEFDIDRPSSAASMRKRVLPVEINLPKNWETGIVCNDLKIMRINNVDNYLVAKNCGEVLCCRKYLGVVKMERFMVTSDTSSVTNMQVSSDLPYFLAATDTGTVNLCSLLENRVLLTLDCRNIPPGSDAIDKCQADHRGRFVSSSTQRSSVNLEHTPLTKLQIKSLHWSRLNPCSIYVVLLDGSIVLFELTHSDIYAKCVCANAATECAASDSDLAMLTPEGEVRIHRLNNSQRTEENLNIFQKYVSLL